MSPKNDRPTPKSEGSKSHDKARDAKPEGKSIPGDRIAKVIARVGLASRRDAEVMIGEGRVSVNGRTVVSPALNVMPKDRIMVDGKPLAPAEPPRLWLYHKPAGLVTSARDEKGRETVFDNLPKELPRVMSIGRLDLTSEGLLLLTNDGELKRLLELPDTGWLRKYRVRVRGTATDATLEPLRKGITIDGEHFQPMEVAFDRQQGANAWFTVGLREGKNREIRRAMEHVGLTVNRLLRLSYGPFRLGALQPGEVSEVRARVLRDQLGFDPYGNEDGDQNQRRDVSRSGGGRSDRDDRPRGDRGRDDRGRNDRGRDGPKRDFGGKPPRDGDRGRGPDRREGRRDDRGGDGGFKSHGYRSHGGGADRPARSSGFKSHGDKPRSGGRDDKPRGDRPYRDNSSGDRPRRDGNSWGDKSRSGGGQGGRGRDDNSGDRPRRDNKSWGDKPRSGGGQGGRGRDDTARGDRKPWGDKPRGDKPRFDKSRSDKPRGSGSGPKRDGFKPRSKPRRSD